MSWVINSVERSMCYIISRYHLWILVLVSVSNALNGSSRSATPSEDRYVRSSAALWRIPPESWLGYWYWVPSSPNSANNGAACSLACHWQMLYAPVYSQHFLHWHYPTGIKGLRNYLTLNFSFKAPLVLFIISELYNKTDGIIIYFFRFSI